MSANEKVIRTFYAALNDHDASFLVTLYTDTIRFGDPVFPNLVGDQAKNMWRMLCSRSKDLKVEVHDIIVDNKKGTAIWEAWYTFGTTGRKVHNIIHARYEFEDGKIVRHEDSFSFWRWSRQALGPIGLLLGWSPFLLNKVRATARTSLAAFSSQNTHR